MKDSKKPNTFRNSSPSALKENEEEKKTVGFERNCAATKRFSCQNFYLFLMKMNAEIMLRREKEIETIIIIIQKKKKLICKIIIDSNLSSVYGTLHQ